MNFPIYLTRLLSSILCGLCIVALFCAEYGAYVLFTDDRGNLLYLLYSVPDWNFAVSTVLIAGVFVIGELFTGYAEAAVFDPIFENIRSAKPSKRNFSVLEKVHPKQPKCHCYLLPIPCVFRCNCCRVDEEKLNHKISFDNFVKFTKSTKSITFSLSEMYFNIHRTLGGIYVFFWIATAFYILSFFACAGGWFQLDISFGEHVVLIIGNLILTLFVAIHAYRQRMFANHLICFGR